MTTLFQIPFEFDRPSVLEAIERQTSRCGKGYVCVVDGNVLATANKDPNYLEMLRGACVNICDGSSIALLGGILHRTQYASFTGPELLIECLSGKSYRSLFLGSSESVLQALKTKLSEIDNAINNMQFIPLPYCSVEDFDYQTIGQAINQDKPDLVWVSLGAPKQEFFIQRLLPHVDKGIFIGIGAALDFYSGLQTHRRAPAWLRRLHMEWAYRAIKEPRIARRAWRYLLALPGMIIAEFARGTE